MKKLSDNWLTENRIDFEYKKYTLLAYLQAVSKNFEHKKIFPDLPDVQTHYENTWTLSEKKALFRRMLPGNLVKIDLENFQLWYEKADLDFFELEEIDAILSFAIPKFQAVICDGTDLCGEVENSLNISPIGLLPIRTDEGYFFIYEEMRAETRIYQFKLSIFQNKKDEYRSLSTTHIDTVRFSFSNTFEQIKLSLVRQNRALPNPATYLVEAKVSYPFEETLLPIASKCLSKFIVNLS